MVNDYDERYAEYQEKHRYDVLRFFGNIKPTHIAILLGMFIIAIVYKEVNTGTNMNNYIIGACVVALVFYLASQSKDKQNITWDDAETILYKIISADMKKENSDFPNGRLEVSKKGWPIPWSENPYYHIYFYISEYKTGKQYWYIGRVSKKDGDYGGCHEVKGDISGEPPHDFEYGRQEYEGRSFK